MAGRGRGQLSWGVGREVGPRARCRVLELLMGGGCRYAQLGDGCSLRVGLKNEYVALNIFYAFLALKKVQKNGISWCYVLNSLVISIIIVVSINFKLT